MFKIDHIVRVRTPAKIFFPKGFLRAVPVIFVLTYSPPSKMDKMRTTPKELQEFLARNDSFIHVTPIGHLFDMSGPMMWGVKMEAKVKHPSLVTPYKKHTRNLPESSGKMCGDPLKPRLNFWAM